MKSDDAITAWSCVGETYVVTTPEPLQRIVEVGWKPVPVTVSTNAGPPAATTPGEAEEILGLGFWIVNATAFETAPPGFTMLTTVNPPNGIALPGIVAVSCVAEATVAGTCEPLICTEAPPRKPLPFAVNVNVVPAGWLLGEIDVRARDGAMRNWSEASDTPAPGVLTNTFALPCAETKSAGTVAVSVVGPT